MKSEDEIRRHRDDLLILMKSPCSCRGTVHEIECRIGGRMMEASAYVLSWVLGEAGSYQETVERMKAHTENSAGRTQG